MGQKNAVRFKNFVNQKEASSLEKDSQGNYQNIATSRVDQALCFDYEALRDNYGINLEVETVHEDEPDPIDINENDNSKPY